MEIIIYKKVYKLLKIFKLFYILFLFCQKTYCIVFFPSCNNLLLFVFFVYSFIFFVLLFISHLIRTKISFDKCIYIYYYSQSIKYISFTFISLFIYFLSILAHNHFLYMSFKYLNLGDLLYFSLVLN